MSSVESRSRAILSIRLKLALLVFGLVAIVAVFTGWLSYTPLREVAENVFDKQIVTATNACAKKIDDALEAEAKSLVEQSKAPDVVSTVFHFHGTEKDLLARRPEAYELCQRVRNLSHWIDLGILDTNGRFVSASDPEWHGATPSEAFQNVELGSSDVPQRPFLYKSRLVCAIEARVVDHTERGEERCAGRLVALVDLDRLLSAVESGSNLGSSKRLICAALSERGERCYYHRDPHGNAELDALPFQASEQQSTPSKLHDANGREVLAAFAHVNSIDAGLAFVVDAEEQHAELATLQVRFLWILLGVLLMGTLGAFFLARHFTEPILQLVRAAERVTAGERGVQVAPRDRDEIGRLIEGFNRMTAELDRSYQTLERRVRERTAELESLNSEISSFSHSVAHDLRAPLRAIAGYGDILCDEKTLPLDDESRDMLDRMRHNARRLGQLIDGLLAFSGIGRRELCILPVEPARIVRQVLDDFEHLTRDRRIDFELRELTGCEADERLLSLVFSNLISNAIKYTRRREHASIVIGCEKRDGESAYYVRDDGVGFDMRHATELFGIFQRLHARDEFEGTGVGLAIARRIVERHGGRIWAEAQPDQGATFWFTIGRVGIGPNARSTREMAVA